MNFSYKRKKVEKGEKKKAHVEVLCSFLSFFFLPLL